MRGSAAEASVLKKMFFSGVRLIKKNSFLGEKTPKG
jgi:hypothetical protein